MNNPFEFGRELGTGELVDRHSEVAEVVQTVDQGAKLFLIGPRRFGKTSILKAAEDRLGQTRAVVLRFDAESYPSLDLLVTNLIADAAKHLKGPVERVGEQMRSFFSRLRPELTFNVTQDSWSAKLGLSVTSNPQGHAALLVDALNGLETLATAQPKNRPVGLIIDEFQKIIEMGGPQAESQIRAAIQRHKRVGYVFAGSKTRMLTAMTMDVARPFYRLGTVRFLGPVPTLDFEAFLTAKFQGSGFRIESPTPIQKILELAENVPYNVQMLAHACWNKLRSRPARPTPVLSSIVVRESMNLLVRQYDPFYTQTWAGLTSIQQKALIAVIEEDGLRLQSQKVAEFIGKGASTVKRSLDLLTDKDILREQQFKGGVQLRFEDPFFSQWIRALPANVTGFFSITQTK
ncbi:ATP-binding protein [Granulicella sp. L46]|uniref:AAA family ATPase n=1 Tax=Granulicella sp. L46 TaxID=1641865 RepID=UPI00131D3D0C|nr:AAA family ATPase [Granulicella sp. L46]